MYRVASNPRLPLPRPPRMFGFSTRCRIRTAAYGQLSREYVIHNTDRSVGGRISGKIATLWGNKGFEAGGGNLDLVLKGSAGQSFGSFNLPGVSLRLEGEANDYVGKGMNGGQIVIVPHR